MEVYNNVIFLWAMIFLISLLEVQRVFAKVDGDKGTIIILHDTYSA